VFRCVFGLPILLAVGRLERRRYGPLPAATVRLAALAGVLFAGDLVLWHHAIEAVGAGLATVLGNLQVLVVGLVAWAAFGERPPRSTLAAVPIVLAGIALISGLGGGAYGADPVRGAVLGILTAFFYAGYLILIRRGGQDLRRPAGPVAIATASTAAAATLIGLLGRDLDPLPAARSLGWLALLGVTSQSAGYLLISLSLPRLPAVLTSILLRPRGRAGWMGLVGLMSRHRQSRRLRGRVERDWKLGCFIGGHFRVARGDAPGGGAEETST